MTIDVKSINASRTVTATVFDLEPLNDVVRKVDIDVRSIIVQYYLINDRDDGGTWGCRVFVCGYLVDGTVYGTNREIFLFHSQPQWLRIFLDSYCTGVLRGLTCD
jgi:hypothetical protein